MRKNKTHVSTHIHISNNLNISIPIIYQCFNTVFFLLQSLAIFHQSLQKYAATIYKLKTIVIDSNGTTFNNKRRLRMLNRVQDELKRLICEVESQMEPPMEKKKVQLEEMKIRLPKELDVTHGFMQYRGILNKCTTFLKKSKKVLFGNDRKSTNKKRKGRKQTRGKKARV